MAVIKTKELQRQATEIALRHAGRANFDALKDYVFNSIKKGIAQGYNLIRFEHEKKSDQFYWVFGKVSKNEEFGSEWHIYGDWANEEDIAQAKEKAGDSWQDWLSNEEGLMYADIGIQMVNAYDGGNRNFSNIFQGRDEVNYITENPEVAKEVAEFVTTLKKETGKTIIWELG